MKHYHSICIQMYQDHYPWCDYELRSWHGGTEVLAENPSILSEIGEVLAGIRFTPELIAQPGKNESQITKSIRYAFQQRGFTKERKFAAISHKIDMAKPPIVIEFQWNSKNVAFDRDLGGFRILYERNDITCAVIITRSSSLQPILKTIMGNHGLPNKYDSMTTHMDQLINKIWMIGACPLVAIGINERQLIEPELGLFAFSKS
jgi:hypothetical protein